jgi:uncharacterized protein YycO
MKLGTLFFRSTIYLSKLLGKLHAPFCECLITAKDFQAIINTVEPGDIIFTRSRGELGNLLISGDFKHCAMVLNSTMVLEATYSGVHTTAMFDLLKRIDYFCILRATTHNKQELYTAVSGAVGSIGMPYDFIFSEGNKAFYCSEVISFWLEAAKEFKLKYKRTKFIDSAIIYPNDLYSDKVNFIEVLRSSSFKESR